MDERLRRLERAWRESGDVADGVRLLRERIRSGLTGPDMSREERSLLLQGQRDLLLACPSPEAWRRLVELVDGAPPAERAALAEALDRGLARWPDELRATLCQHGHDDALFAGADDPGLRIFRALRYDRVFVSRYGDIMLRRPELDRAMARGLARSPACRWLTRIDLGFQRVDAGCARALAGGAFERLEVLSLRSANLGDRGAAALASAPWLGRLRVLDLSGNGLTAEGLAALLARPLPALEELDLDDNPLGPAGGELLGRTQALPALRRLAASGCRLGDGGVGALAGEGALPALRELSVGKDGLADGDALGRVVEQRALVGLEAPGNDLARGGLAWLARCRSLERLDLADNAIAAATPALAAGTRLPALRALSLGGNALGPDHLAAFLGAAPDLASLDLAPPSSSEEPSPSAGEAEVEALTAAPCAGLRELSLASCALPAAAVEGLTQAAWFPGLTCLRLSSVAQAGPGLEALPPGRRLRLERLWLSDTPLGDDGAARLAALDWSPRVLGLTACELGDAGAAALAHAPALGRLRELLLPGNGVGDDGAVALASSAWLACLELLDVSRNRVRDRGALALAAWSPGPLRIRWSDNDVEEAGRAALEALPRRCCP